MRIITGCARGTKLKAPKGMNTRPTADRIKESLFNILNFKLAGAIILDVFAGSGSLGLEALSRGAKKAVFIDMDSDSIKVVQANVLHTHLQDKADIFQGDALNLIKVLARKRQQFDFIFCDPPYHKGICETVLNMVETYEILSKNGMFIAETGADEQITLEKDRFSLIRSKVYGATTKIDIYKCTVLDNA
ncbi:16S rRNA (guanine(966)-N(2))-methyltransferase RsmD [Pectinatus sottacetonis]|uniref:16S rRNA (guanine(966)-N(2))-methyltransferase RsmD n=1 Tax=Pectinatus sottacetonis TaxID=1002795 RepID=UPI0018C58398|nr:16S rRNA (guanine(966)-N(2))-methyltransferase RsmD [Pectinatus sottacetonis]